MKGLIEQNIDSSKELIKNLNIYKGIVFSNKEYSFNYAGSRSCSISKVIERAERSAKKLGIEEIVNITDIDNLNIPVYSITSKDKNKEINNYNNGKGFTLEQAKISAYMEFIERRAAGIDKKVNIFGSYNELKEIYTSKIMSPSQLITYYKDYITENAKIGWSWAMDITEFYPILIPTVAVKYPFYDKLIFMKNNSNGLAAGSSILEAIIQGIYEVIERDCTSIAMAGGKYEDIDINSIDSEECKNLIKEFKKNYINIYIKNVTNDLGIPCFIVTGDDVKAKNSFYLSGGHGCHTQKDIALMRALTELAQTIKTIKYGKREDIVKMRKNGGEDYVEVKQRNLKWYSNSKFQEDYSKIKSFKFNNMNDELNFLIELLKQKKHKIIVSDLTPNDSEVSVVRVIIPGLENWYDDRKRIGKRLYNAVMINK